MQINLSLVERCAIRGVVGSLRSYSSIMQRLWPQSVTGNQNHSSIPGSRETAQNITFGNVLSMRGLENIESRFSLAVASPFRVQKAILLEPLGVKKQIHDCMSKGTDD